MTPGEWIATGTLALGGVTFLWKTHNDSMATLKTDNETGRNQIVEHIKDLFLGRLERIDKDDVLRDEWLQELANKQEETSGEVLVLKVTVAEHAKKIDDIGQRCERRHEVRNLRDAGV